MPKGVNISHGVGSGVTIELNTAQVPLMAGARDFANMGIIPGGAYTNLEYLQDNVVFDPAVQLLVQDLLPDAVRELNFFRLIELIGECK